MQLESNIFVKKVK